MGKEGEAVMGIKKGGWKGAKETLRTLLPFEGLHWRAFWWPQTLRAGVGGEFLKHWSLKGLNFLSGGLKTWAPVVVGSLNTLIWVSAALAEASE